MCEGSVASHGNQHLALGSRRLARLHVDACATHHNRSQASAIVKQARATIKRTQKPSSTVRAERRKASAAPPQAHSEALHSSCVERTRKEEEEKDIKETPWVRQRREGDRWVGRWDGQGSKKQQRNERSEGIV